MPKDDPVLRRDLNSRYQKRLAPRHRVLAPSKATLADQAPGGAVSAGMTRLPAAPTEPGEHRRLRELAAWYREFAERAGNPTIWEAA